MAKKGYGADPTLVSAAFRLGQSYVPKDYSSIFAKQYEGMIAGYKARYEAMGEGMKSIGEGTGKLLRRNADIKDKRAEELNELDEGLGFDDGTTVTATALTTATGVAGGTLGLISATPGADAGRVGNWDNTGTNAKRIRLLSGNTGNGVGTLVVDYAQSVHAAVLG